MRRTRQLAREKPDAVEAVIDDLPADSLLRERLETILAAEIED